ncbi:signal peptidase I [Rhodococcus xishaensis]|uniref:signal peptidase I n=1 Tax=Rhodococcus xishaensis TaxID=2487364 RepID=UPI001F181B8D|nr:signal peptidase I [Rhodococcus xishaensis]
MTTHPNPMGSDRKLSIREIALNVGAIAGLICVLAAAASFFFGIKPLVFRSGSMSPEITTGSLALSRSVSASDLAVGDVVSVLDAQGTRITHRVEEIVSSNPNSSVLILKGDANEAADVSPYTVSEADRVFFSVPGLGYAVAWLSTPVAIFLGGALVGSLMVIAFRPTAGRNSAAGGSTSAVGPSVDVEPNPMGGSDIAANSSRELEAVPVNATRTLSPTRSLMAVGAAGLTAFVGTAAGTTAAFTDTATAASTFSANANFYPTPVVTSTSCQTVGGWLADDAKVSWTSLGETPLGDDYEYEVVVRRDSNGNVKTRKNVGTATSYTADINDTGRDYTVEVHTVNGPNTSTGWRGQRVQARTVTITQCDGGERYVANPPDENVQSLSAKSVSLASTDPFVEEPIDEPADEPIDEPADEPTEEPADEPTEEPADEPAGDPADDVTDTVESVEDSSSSAITNVSSSGSFVAEVSSSRVVITDESGSVMSSIAVGEKAVVQWAKDSDELWIVDSGELYLVGSSGGWVKTEADPSADGVPAGIAALVQ